MQWHLVLILANELRFPLYCQPDLNALSSAGVLLEIYGLKFALKQYCHLPMTNQRNVAG